MRHTSEFPATACGAFPVNRDAATRLMGAQRCKSSNRSSNSCLSRARSRQRTSGASWMRGSSATRHGLDSEGASANGQAAGGSAPAERKDPHEALVAELERGAVTRYRRRGAPVARLRAQTIVARIRAARPAWRKRLCGLLPLARAIEPEIDANEAPLALSRLEAGTLADAMARLLAERKGWLPELWDALCLDDFHGLVTEKGAGPALDAWNALLRASCLQGLRPARLDTAVPAVRVGLPASRRSNSPAGGSGHSVHPARPGPGAGAHARPAPDRLLGARSALQWQADYQGHPVGAAALSLRVYSLGPAALCRVPRPGGRPRGADGARRPDRAASRLQPSAMAHHRHAVQRLEAHITVRNLHDPEKALLSVPAAGLCDVSPDGLRLATVMNDSSLHVYDIESGACETGGRRRSDPGAQADLLRGRRYPRGDRLRP